MNRRRVYCLPGNSPENRNAHTIIKSYELEEMLRKTKEDYSKDMIKQTERKTNYEN